MARVEMLHHITGGRPDGTPWPHAGGVLECGEQEARDLVAGANARWAALAPEPVQDAPAAQPAGDDPPEPENGSQDDDDDPADGPGRPRVRDPKEAWEQHAITIGGLDVNEARSMTKADLIARFGNPA